MTFQTFNPNTENENLSEGDEKRGDDILEALLKDNEDATFDEAVKTVREHYQNLYYERMADGLDGLQGEDKEEQESVLRAINRRYSIEPEE